MARLPSLAQLLCLAALFASGAPAAAQIAYERFQLRDHQLDRMLSSDYNRCMDNSGGVTSNMRDCAAAEMERFDARLNAVYRAAMARLSRAEALRLRGLQRAWLRTRWNGCRHQAAGETGTMGLLLLDSCGLEEMARRIAWLEQYRR